MLVGELGGDKLPAIPPRSDPLSVAGRLATGALAGWTVGGREGARLGATGAAATTYASERARAILAGRTGLPDPLLGVAEDALAVGVAVAASRDLAPRVAPAAEPGARPPGRPSPLAAAARGLAAAAVGTAAMTTGQTAYHRATGARPSGTPGKVGRRLVHGVLHRRVPRSRRHALNQAMHVLYGASWGVPFGLAAGSRRGAPSPAGGLAFGAVVWAFGLAQLTALKLTPPPSDQPPASLGIDLGFHLVYGAATQAAYRALVPRSSWTT